MGPAAVRLRRGAKGDGGAAAGGVHRLAAPPEQRLLQRGFQVQRRREVPSAPLADLQIVMVAELMGEKCIGESIQR
jgi:hypothetical protein